MKYAKRLVGSAHAAKVLGVPRAWLEAEAVAGRVPALLIYGSPRFDPAAVRRALLARASAPASAPGGCS